MATKEINVLLLGETGVGKSTFINSFVNYLHYNTLQEGRSSDLLCLIPTKFSITDENYEDRIIGIGDDSNENTEVGQSSTQGARAYEFTIDKLNVRLIDTPGIGDSRGISTDKANFENILDYLNQFTHLHAICFLLKPDVSVINPYFKFCITHLFSRLEKSASRNIMFLFTNTRSTCYRPGQTLRNLKIILEEIKSTPPYVEIPCNKSNIFCLDNEAFKFLVALKNGIIFTQQETEAYYSSWEKSATECWNILTYILGDNNNSALKPHDVRSTISVNKARHSIIQLSKPLADMADLIRDNLEVLKKHQDAIKVKNITIEELQEKLFVPSVNVKTTPLSEPVIVCTSKSCCEEYEIGDVKKLHFKKICANPCTLGGVVGQAQLFFWRLVNFTRSCTTCECAYNKHMPISYKTEVSINRVENMTVKTEIRSEEEKILAQAAAIKELEQRRTEYELEQVVISKCMAKFAHFLQQNTIIPYNDAYGNYLDSLIERENGAINPTVERYQEMKKQYENEKNILSKALKEHKDDSNYKVVTAEDIIQSVQDLYNMKHTGETIKSLHTHQEDVQLKNQIKTMTNYKVSNISRQIREALENCDRLEYLLH